MFLFSGVQFVMRRLRELAGADSVSVEFSVAHASSSLAKFTFTYLGEANKPVSVEVTADTAYLERFFSAGRLEGYVLQNLLRGLQHVPGVRASVRTPTPGEVTSPWRLRLQELIRTGQAQVRVTGPDGVVSTGRMPGFERRFEGGNGCVQAEFKDGARLELAGAMPLLRAWLEVLAFVYLEVQHGLPAAAGDDPASWPTREEDPDAARLIARELNL